MIGDLKPYADYKDSGLTWQGSIPAHWTVWRVSRFAKVGNGSTPSRARPRYWDGGSYPWLNSSQVNRGYIDHADQFITPTALRECHLPKVPAGSVLVAITGQGKTRGMSAKLGIEATINQHIAYITPRLPVVSTDYLHLALSAAYPQLRAISDDTGSTKGALTCEDLKRFKLALPTQDEQAAIVRFLAWANGKLDRAIRAKRKVIALLLEQKQATVQRLVLQGRDSRCRSKPTGVEWLGDVPEHWEVRPLKAVSQVQSGVTLGKDYGGERTHEFPYLRVANVQAGFVNLSEVKTIRVPKTEALRSTLAAGDVLMTEGGDPDKLGRGCVWDGQVAQCLHQNHVFAVRPDRERLVPRFLAELLGTGYARAYFQSTAKQTTNLASTNKTKIGRLQVPLPPVAEQHEILAAVTAETSPLNAAVARLEGEIQLLREYRIRMVTDIVSGRLDVRAVAARLPDDATTEPQVVASEVADDLEPSDEEATEA